MKKKTIFTAILVVLVSTLTLTSCSYFKSYNISNVEDVKEILKKAEKEFPDKNVIGIQLYAKENLSETFGIMSVIYFENDALFQKTYASVAGKWANPTEVRHIKIKDEAEKTLRLKNVSDISFDDVTKLKEESIKLLESMTDEFEGCLLYSFEKMINAKGKTITNLTLNARKKGESSSLQGKNVVTTYYEFRFKTNDEGSLEYVE